MTAQLYLANTKIRTRYNDIEFTYNLMNNAHQINDSFRKEIRNRQKQQLFKQIRSKYQGIFSNKNQSFPQNIEISKNNSQSFLKSIAEQIKKSDGMVSCNKIIDQGGHIDLMNNLKNNFNIDATLQVISAILAKEKIKVAHKFVRLGLIEQLIRHSLNSTSIIRCMNIMANIIFQNIQFAQLMLENKVHHNLFVLMQNLMSNKEKLNSEDDETGFMIMWAIAALLQVENSKQYRQQFLEILQFALQIFKRDLYTSIVIQIIFLVGYSFRQETQNAATWAINTMLNETANDANYLQYLLIVIKLLTPIKIDYSKIANISNFVDSKLISYCVRILSKVAPEGVPHNMQWWELFYLKLKKPQDIQEFVKLLSRSKIREQFSYRILNDILQKYCPQYLTLTCQVLSCINQQVQKTQTIENKRKAKYYLRSCGIYDQLYKLYHTKKIDIQRKSEYLLTVLNMLDSIIV